MVDRGLWLEPFSWLYQASVALRNFGYEHNWLKSSKAHVPVISVGNISVGGTGKTPVVLLLARLFHGEVAVLSRGYKSESEHGAPKKVFLEMSAKECGDEPLLIKKHFSNAEIWAGKERRKALPLIKNRVIILDDGFQHRQIARDLDIVVVDGKDPLLGENLLPRGNLREPPSSLRRADLILAIDGPADQIKKHTNAPIIPLTRHLDLSPYQGKRVALFCGIGNPERFFSDVRKGDLEVVATYSFGDHDHIEQEKLDTFATQAEEDGAELLLCTEKDSIKNYETTLPIHSVPLELKGNLQEISKIIHRKI